MENKEQTLSTKYDPQAIERDRYDYWLKGKFLKLQTTRKSSRTRL